jgi:hypothetical protein
MRIRSAGLIFSVVLIAVPAALAQQVFMNRSSQTQGDTTTLTFGSPRAFAVTPVTGAPYTADRVTENTQTLADGTHIRHPPDNEHMSRDSQGRTRTERPGYFNFVPLKARSDAGDFRLIEIIDPAAGVAYLIDDRNKVAHRVTLQSHPPIQPATRAAASAGSALTVVSGAGGVVSGTGGAIARAQTPDATSPQHLLEKLESEKIEGVFVEGTRRTTTWPVDSQGNDRPIVQSNESWFSPELKMMILVKNNDPRNGESVMKLINLSTAEPDASLFQPPVGYTIVDEKDSFTMTIKH